MYKVLILFVIFSSACICSEAQTIWLEDFDESNGATSGTASGAPGGTWSVTTGAGGGTFSAQNGEFSVDNTSHEGTWKTNVINISSYGYAIVEVLLQGVGLSFGGDYITCSYIVDGGAEVQFADINGAFLYNGAVQGSAIVSGNTLQVVIRGYDGGFLSAFSFDKVTITAANKLYSRKTGDWNDLSAVDGTWSLTSHIGAACACTMNDRTTALVGPGHIVSLTQNESVGGVDVEPLGVLQWTGANQQLSVVRGYLGVRGELRGNNYTNAGINLSGAYATTVDVSGFGTIDDLVITNAPSVSINGAGSLTMDDQLAFGTSGTAFSNNLPSLSFGTLNGQNFTNSFSNAGTINQATGFTNTGNLTMVNQTNAVWNYSGAGAPGNNVNCTATNNTFNYDGSGDQAVRSGTYYHVRFTNSAIKTVGGTLTANGNFSIENSAAVNCGGNTISVGGNWSMLNSSLFLQTTGSVYFIGSNNSIISLQSGDDIFNILRVAKSASTNTVTMTSDISITTTLTLTTGRLVLNGNTLNIIRNVPAGISGGSTSSFIISETVALPYSNINWTMANSSLPQSYTFPFGTAAGNYIPLTFNLTNVGAGAVGRSVSVSSYPTILNNTPYPSGVFHVADALGVDISANVVDRFWMITPVGYTTQPTADVTFTAAAAEVGSITNLRAQHWNSSIIGWDPPKSGQTSTATTAKVTGVNGFSPWTMSGSTTPLPVTLTSFSVKQQGSEALLQWSTATELNSDYFTVERSTGDLEKFTVIDRQEGNGTANTAHHYSAFDTKPVQGKNYYRLKQVDFDGNYSYSDIEVLDFDGGVIDGPIMKVYPNPSVSGKVTVEIHGLGDGDDITISLIDMKGQTVLERAFRVDSGGVLTKDIAFDTQLPHGLYVIKAGPVVGLSQKIIIE